MQNMQSHSQSTHATSSYPSACPEATEGELAIHRHNYNLLNKHFNTQNKSSLDFLIDNDMRKYLQYNSRARTKPIISHCGILGHFGVFRIPLRDIFMMKIHQLNINIRSATIDFEYHLLIVCLHFNSSSL